MFYLSFYISRNIFFIIPALKQKNKDKTKVINPKNLFLSLACVNIFVLLKTVKNTVNILSASL